MQSSRIRAGQLSRLKEGGRRKRVGRRREEGREREGRERESREGGKEKREDG